MSKFSDDGKGVKITIPEEKPKKEAALRRASELPVGSLQRRAILKFLKDN